MSSGVHCYNHKDFTHITRCDKHKATWRNYLMWWVKKKHRQSVRLWVQWQLMWSHVFTPSKRCKAILAHNQLYMYSVVEFLRFKDQKLCVHLSCKSLEHCNTNLSIWIRLRCFLYIGQQTGQQNVHTVYGRQFQPLQQPIFWNILRLPWNVEKYLHSCMKFAPLLTQTNHF